MIFLFTFVTFSKQIAGLEKKFYSMEWPANKDERVDRPNITVSWTGTKLGLCLKAGLGISAVNLIINDYTGFVKITLIIK